MSKTAALNESFSKHLAWLFSANEGVNVGESWTTWAFSWMPAILPLVIEDENNPYDPALLQIDHTFRLGVYIDVFTLAFKVL